MVAFIEVSEEQLAQAPPDVRAYLTQLRSDFIVKVNANARLTPPSSQPGPAFASGLGDKDKHAEKEKEVAKPDTVPPTASTEHHLDGLKDSLDQIHSLLVNRQQSWPRVAAEKATAVVGTLHAIQGPSAAVSSASASIRESTPTGLPVRSKTDLTNLGDLIDSEPVFFAASSPSSSDGDTPPASPPAIKVQGIHMPPMVAKSVRPVALPDFTGSDSAILEELVQFGTKHWPEKNLGQFRPGEAVSWPMFNELVQHMVLYDLEGHNYIHRASTLAMHGQPHKLRGIVWPQYIGSEDTASGGETSKRHFTIAVVDLQKRSFTSWGMGNHQHSEGKAGYENSLGYSLVGFKFQLPDFSGGMSAIRCIEAVHEYCTGSCSQVTDSIAVRLAFLKRLLFKLVETNRTGISTPSVTLLSPRRPSVSSHTSRVTHTSSHKRHAEDLTDQADAGKPPLKKKVVSPPTELLVQEITNDRAMDRMRQHLRNWKNDAHDLQWDKQGNWAEQTSDILNIADSLDVKLSVTRKVVAMILRTHALRILYKRARDEQDIDDNAADPQLPTAVLDKVYPQVRQNKTAAASRRWLTLTRKLEKLSDYLPFIPHGTGTPVTFREYERLSNENIQQLLTHLANDSVGRRVARAGRAFRNHVLYRSNQTYVWETMSNDDLRKLSNNDLLSMIPQKTRRPAKPNEFDDSDDEDYYSCQLDDDDEDEDEDEDDQIEEVVRQSMPGAVGQTMMFNTDLLQPASSTAGASEDWDVLSSTASSHVSRRYSSAQDGSSTAIIMATISTHNHHHHHQQPYHSHIHGHSHSHSHSLGSFLDLNDVTTDLAMDWVGLPQTDGDYLSDYPDYPAVLEDPTFQEIPPPLHQPPMPITMLDSSEAITFALKGNIPGLARLFSEGRVSPMHVSQTRGFTLMRWALYGGMHNYKTVQFLISKGAPIDDESYAHAWDFQMRNKCSTDEKYELQCITEYKNRDWVDEQGFPEIHQIVFGTLSHPLEDYVRENPFSVQLRDSLGRTAMDWAVARKQLHDMHTLIRYGASVNTMDNEGRTTLQHAIDSHSIETLRVVLEAGADPNCQIPSRFHRSSAVTSASLAGDVAPGMVALLIQYDARINALNPEGQTALERAALTDNLACAQVLIANGADMDHVSGTGITPMQAAVKHNSHAVLSYFVSLASENRGFGPDHLIEYVLKYGDATTQKIFIPYEVV
ncbi:ankyrin repeat containing protein [Ophiostoma piceae UAMH 11346]|uniref:Ankyrin repeat containing protein n=1 Tax=Ophiostoma piceae (strain UAMH 11346) TaxID=1262450 RepID=S3C9H4_OPHP1|nr:ankyrin repeat containing protein [Ophiostoma piceae UAMH 11346]